VERAVNQANLTTPTVVVDRTQVGVFASELTRLAQPDRPNFVLVSADSAGSLRFNAFRERHPERVVEAGIAEGCAVAVAFGLSRAGLKVFVGGYATFLLMRSVEVIRSYLAYQRADVTVIGGMTGFSASHDGYMHQAVEDIGLVRAIGGVRILVPSDDEATRAAARTCLEEPGPSYVRLVRREIALPPVVERAGALAWRVRGGSDVLICSYGQLLVEAVAAAHALSAQKIGTSVLEVGCIAPLPVEELRAALAPFRRVWLVEDHDSASGLGAAIVESLAETPLAVRRLGVSIRALQSGTYEAALEAAGLTARQIAQAVTRES